MGAPGPSSYRVHRSRVLCTCRVSEVSPHLSLWHREAAALSALARRREVEHGPAAAHSLAAQAGVGIRRRPARPPARGGLDHRRRPCSRCTRRGGHRGRARRCLPSAPCPRRCRAARGAGRSARRPPPRARRWPTGSRRAPARPGQRGVHPAREEDDRSAGRGVVLAHERRCLGVDRRRAPLHEPFLALPYEFRRAPPSEIGGRDAPEHGAAVEPAEAVAERVPGAPHRERGFRHATRGSGQRG